jgi:hypothetical protein
LFFGVNDSRRTKRRQIVTNQLNVYQPAIEALEKDLDEAERHVNALRTSINLLRAKAGMGPMPDGGGGPPPSGGGKPSTTPGIRSDQFFGKKGQTAIREFLELRNSKGLGPATAREIHDGLVAGGFNFEAKDDNTAMIGLRATLRKRSETFVKMKNGNYGLRAWYPDLKKAKPTTAKEGGSTDTDVDLDLEEKETASLTDEAAA